MKLNQLIESVDWNRKSEIQQINMVQRSSKGITCITHPSTAVLSAAIHAYPWAIEYVKNPSEELQLEAVNIQGWVIKHIDNPSEAVQLAAIRNDLNSIVYLDKPYPSVIKAVLTNETLINNKSVYENLIVRLFENNALLMKKWLRYGDAMRNQK